MRHINDVKRKAILLLFLLCISYALYLLVAFDFVPTYEIFADLALFFTLQGSLGLLFLIVANTYKTKVFLNTTLSLLICAITFCFIITFGYRNGWFEGQMVMDAAFLDDRSRMDLELYKNGKYIIYSNWLFGEERFEGEYTMQGDTIKFATTPVTDNDFIAQKVLIDRKENRIYFHKLSDGQYEKDFYYFQIDF